MKSVVPRSRKFCYLPAINSSIQQYQYLIEGSDGNEYVTNWWDKKSPYYYDSALISAFYGMQVGDKFREAYKFPEEFQLYADSGGFQVVTQQANISCLEVLQWQERTSDYGLILDHPPYEVAEGAQFGGNIHNVFEKSKNRTVENADLMLKNKEKDFKLYGVVQGESAEQMLDWHSKMTDLEDKYEKFYAWALSPKPSFDVMKIGLYGVLALEHLDTPIHILQVSGFDSTVISAYISSLYKHKVTLDSSSYMIGIRFGKALDEYDTRQHWRFGKDPIKNPVRFSRLPSSDLVGSILSDIPIDEYTNAHYNMMNVHNLLKYIRFFNYLEVLSEDRDSFIDYIKRTSSTADKVLKAIEMVDYGADRGLEKAFNKYKHRIDVTAKPNKQDSIFGEWQ